MKKHCPTCSKFLTTFKIIQVIHFCSDRCKLLDLGAWASEQFIIKGKENDTSSENEA